MNILLRFNYLSQKHSVPYVYVKNTTSSVVLLSFFRSNNRIISIRYDDTPLSEFQCNNRIHLTLYLYSSRRIFQKKKKIELSGCCTKVLSNYHNLFIRSPVRTRKIVFRVVETILHKYHIVQFHSFPST